MKQHSLKHLSTGLVFGCACLLTLNVSGQGFGGRGGGFGGSRGSTTYPSSTSVGQATFMSDPETRKVIAVTDAETAKYISQIITNLDRPAPQVLIKVVFVEATYNKSLDLGIEGNFTKNIGNGMTNVITQNFGLAANGASPNPPGAGIYQILGQDFQATLRAIATAGKAEILSRPSILARNNQQASISLGQLVPIINGTRYDTLGNQINTFTYQNVGIGLTVTPFITTDGMVEMVVSPQTSALADRSQWVTTSSGPSGNIASPVINSRTADTVVIVPDGQTAIIGGLMEKQLQDTDSKIPLLGDIPGLGFLFKHKTRSDVRTELLIFLTPYIVAHPSQLAGLSDKERSSANLPKSMSEQELDRFLDKLPAKTDPDSKKSKK